MKLKNKNSAKDDFLRKHISTKFSIKALPNDASFRVYERITTPKQSFILMDSSLEMKSVESFIKVGKFLNKNNYSSPKIIAEDKKAGFILLEDLGNTTYTKKLQESTDIQTEYNLYKNAVDVLISLHQLQKKIDLVEYSKELLMGEALLLVDYYMKILHDHDLSKDLRDEYIAAWGKVFDCIYYKNSCLVLRDYHVDNLMCLDDRTGMQNVGLLDFQDAVIGSYAYDLVSLFEDARRDVSQDVVSQITAYYLNNMPMIDNKKLLADYAIFGVQRSCKIIGIFARKAIRDNDNRYLKHLPRTWLYVKNNINNPLLEPIKNWFSKVDIPIMRDAIEN
jgi:N-acetylmuramate 1-kinase